MEGRLLLGYGACVLLFCIQLVCLKRHIEIGGYIIDCNLFQMERRLRRHSKVKEFGDGTGREGEERAEMDDIHDLMTDPTHKLLFPPSNAMQRAARLLVKHKNHLKEHLLNIASFNGW